MNISREQLILYAVTDRSWLNGRTLYEQVEEALEGGTTLVQLREKNMPDKDFINEAVPIMELCHRYNVPLIIMIELMSQPKYMQTESISVSPIWMRQKQGKFLDRTA